MGPVLRTVGPGVVVAVVVGACSGTVVDRADRQPDAAMASSSGGTTGAAGAVGAGGRLPATGGVPGTGGSIGVGGRPGTGGAMGSGGFIEMGTGGEGPVCQAVVARPEPIIVYQDGGIATSLPCTWKISPPPAGTYFDPGKVNVIFTPYGNPPLTFGYVVSPGACAPNSWYYDNPAQPSQIILCPTTCDMMKASANSSIGIAFGCPTPTFR